MNAEELIDQYPDYDMSGRVRVAYNWLPDKLDRLLDAGCSYGYGTRFYKQKSGYVLGIDPDEDSIKIASLKYKGIDFQRSTIEKNNFESGSFDAAVLTDVLEHTNDKIKSLNELFRVLKPGSTLVITTPHKGLFGFLDPYNYGYYLKSIPFIYKPLYKLIRLVKEGKLPKEYNPGHFDKHWHYSRKDFIAMLDASDFKGHYTIEQVFRSGFLIEPIALNLEVALRIVLHHKTARAILKPLFVLADLDYRIPYGPLAYNIAIKVRKK